MFTSVIMSSALVASSYALAIPQSADVTMQPAAFGNFQVDYTASITGTPTPSSTMQSYWGSSTTPTSWTLSTTITAVSSEADPVSTDTTCTASSTVELPVAYGGSTQQTTAAPTTIIPTINYIGSSTTPTSWTLSTTISTVDSLSQGPTTTPSAPLEYGTIALTYTTPIETSLASPAEQTSSFSSTTCTEEEAAATSVASPAEATNSEPLDYSTLPLTLSTAGPISSSVASPAEATAPLEYGNIQLTYTTPTEDYSTLVSPAEATSTPCTKTITVSPSSTDVVVAPVDASSSPIFYNGGNSTTAYGYASGSLAPTGTGIVAPTGVMPIGTGALSYAPLPTGASSYAPIPTTMATLVSPISSVLPSSTAPAVATPAPYHPPPPTAYGQGRAQTLRQRLSALARLLAERQ